MALNHGSSWRSYWSLTSYSRRNIIGVVCRKFYDRDNGQRLNWLVSLKVTKKGAPVGMYKDFRVIDADAHITEPHDLWSEYIEHEYYERRPIVGPIEESRPGASRSFSGGKPASIR